MANIINKMTSGNELVRKLQSEAVNHAKPRNTTIPVSDTILKPIRVTTGEVVEFWNENVASNYVFQSNLNKLRRLGIIYDRETSGKPQDTTHLTYQAARKVNHHTAFENDEPLAEYNNPWYWKKKIFQTQAYKDTSQTTHRYGSTLTRNNEIIIVNTHTSPATSIIIQNRPTELTVNPGTSWASVKSAGRNNAFQVYTGSEETISFKVSWFSSQPDRRDVIMKCRLLESWAKADGYNAAPPTLNILWGNSEMFDGHEFILTNASYVLSQFQDSHKTSDGIVDLKLLPNVAVQTLTFKRVSINNLAYTDTYISSDLKGIKGIQNG